MAPSANILYRGPLANAPFAPGRSSFSSGSGAAPIADAFIVTILLTLPIVAGTLADLLSAFFTAVTVFAVVTLYAVANLRLGRNGDASGFLFVPLLISASQNIYLGLLAPYTDAIYIQLALLTHVAFALFLLIAYLLTGGNKTSQPVLVPMLVSATALVAFAIVSTIAFRASPIGMVSSARNLGSPLLFSIIGLVFADRTKLRNLLWLIGALAWATIAFGAIEYFFWPEVWGVLNIEKLWPKKGIPNLASWGLPANFVSSELFFGEQLRRMVSSYADPVNFGTVLFLFFMVAWYTRRWLLLCLCGVAIILAVSKGGVLGILIFLFLLARASKNRLLFVGGAIAAAVAGGGVIAYSLLYSTQSLTIHVQGLWAALATLPQYPFGRGLGGAGVLVELDGDLRESGLGLMIGQLGIFAFLIFGVFVYSLVKGLNNLPDQRQKVFGFALFLGICANIAFNEVALSPNSCAGYFLLIGLLIGTSRAGAERLAWGASFVRGAAAAAA